MILPVSHLHTLAPACEAVIEAARRGEMASFEDIAAATGLPLLTVELTGLCQLALAKGLHLHLDGETGTVRLFARRPEGVPN